MASKCRQAKTAKKVEQAKRKQQMEDRHVPSKKSKKTKHVEPPSKEVEEEASQLFADSSADSEEEFGRFREADLQDPSQGIPKPLADILKSIMADLAELKKKVEAPADKCKRGVPLARQDPIQQDLVEDDQLGEEDEILPSAEGLEADWSDDPDEEEPPATRLFHSQRIEPLLKRGVSAALDLTQGSEESQPSTSKLAALLGQQPKKPVGLKVPDSFKAVTQVEFDFPLKSKRLDAQARKLYTLEQGFMDLIKVPRVDAAVAGLVSKSLMPKEEGSQLKDPSERRMDFAFKRAHEASGLAVRASCSASLFTRAILAWLEEYAETQPPESNKARRLWANMQCAASFVADATLDASQFASRSIAASVVGRRSLWLKHWEADHSARATLASKPFKGTLLFGEEALKEVLVDTKHKTQPHLVTAKKDQRRPFRRSQAGFVNNQSFHGSRSFFKGRDQKQPGQTTVGIHNSTWQSFAAWCAQKRANPEVPSVPLLLEFLQVGLERGLQPNTLWKQASEISSVLATRSPGLHSLATLPLVKRYLRGAELLYKNHLLSPLDPSP